VCAIVIVPYRPDRGHRDELWSFLRDRYWEQSGYDVVLGEHLDGPFNRSKALNQAADRAWQYAIIADSDTWVPAANLHRALLTAKISQRLTAAFDSVVEISQLCTRDIVAGRLSLEDSFATDCVRRRDMETQSSMLVVPRTLWDKVGGFDENFEGWGGEDSAFWKACTLHAGQPHRVAGNAYHLWHPPANGKRTGPEYAKNLALWRRYESAQTIKDLPCTPSESSPTSHE